LGLALEDLRNFHVTVENYFSGVISLELLQQMYITKIISSWTAVGENRMIAIIP